MNRQINQLNSTVANNRSKKLLFSDVIASQRPQSADQVAERWLFLNSEYERSQWKREKRNIAISFFIVIGFALFVYCLSWIIA